MVVGVGVDGARSGATSGWIVVRTRDGRLDELRFVDGFAPVLEVAEEARVVLVDVPIGHDDPDGRSRAGRRQADEVARAFVGSLASSVFGVPAPAVLAASDYEAARRVAESRGWVLPGAQGWGLRDRIHEVAPLAARDQRVLEGHPEVSFRALKEELGGLGPLLHAKSTWNGLFERLDLLRRAGLRPKRSLGGIGRVGPDDVLDATVLAWSSERLARSRRRRSLPSKPPNDPATGRPVAIWY